MRKHASGLAAAFGLAAALVLGLAEGLAAQGEQPPFSNAKLQARPVASGLATTFDTIVSAQKAPAWIAYAVPAVAGEHRSCDAGAGSGGRVVHLESKGTTGRRTDRVSLEGPSEILVLFRAEQGRVQRIRIISPDCEVDAGGLPVSWLTEVQPGESIVLLSSFVGDGRRSNGESTGRAALTAIALHRDAAATAALQRFVSAGQPAQLRKQSAFWLAASRGREGFQVLTRLLDDPDAAFRAELTFPIYVSKEAETTDILVRMAREDESARVRRQALFWLGQKAGAKAASTLAGAVDNDPDTEVRKRAVFAISQLPKDEGVPRLIDIARTHRNLEVRRQAMFWLGQSNDPRALAFFEEILKK